MYTEVIYEVCPDRRESSFVVYFGLCGLTFPNCIFEITSRKAKVALQNTKNCESAETNANTRL